jgi:hypothetical protein
MRYGFDVYPRLNLDEPGRIHVYFLLELSEKLQGLIVRRMGVLWLEGYRVRAL